MPQKRIVIDGVGEVLLQKRKGSHSLRLSVGHDGELRVSMPVWSPYKVGEAFVISKSDWIKKQLLTKQKRIFRPFDRIGKAHRLQFIPESRTKVTSRVTKTEIIIRHPVEFEFDNGAVQKIVYKAAVRALKREANMLLPGRLESLAQMHGFSYKSLSIKQLKTRWGSCSSQKDIALNCFLMQLPWELVDYVIMHELLHTQIMTHGKPFWDELNHYVKDLPVKRRAIRAHQPAVIAAL